MAPLRVVCRSTRTVDSGGYELDGTTLRLENESEVERLLLELGILVNGSIKRKNDLRRKVHKRLEKAKARYTSGGSTSALVSMRQVQKMRMQEACERARWCKLLGIFVQIQAELEECQYFSSGDPILVELELEFFESTAEKVKEKICEIKAMLQDDDTLYKELNKLLCEVPLRNGEELAHQCVRRELNVAASANDSDGPA